MNKKNGMLEILRGISYLSQVGLSVATPIVLCLMGTLWLSERFQIGSWIVLVGLLTGLTSGLVSLWKFLQHVQKSAQRDQEAGSRGGGDRREE